jgi:Uma2 family endonuclease
MTTSTKLVTAEELVAMGEDAPYELIRGQLRWVSPTKGWHGFVSGRFAGEFCVYSITLLPGEVFTAEAGLFAEQDPDTVIAPDLAFYCAERVPSQEALEADFLRVPPDAVLEVLSPSNRRSEVDEKVLIYLVPACRSCWSRTPNVRRSPRERRTVGNGSLGARTFLISTTCFRASASRSPGFSDGRWSLL